MTKTLAQLLNVGMQIRVGDSDKNCTVVRIDTAQNQAWVRFSKGNGLYSTWDNIPAFCAEFASLLDTGVIPHIIDIGRGQAFCLTKNEIADLADSNPNAVGTYMAYVWTATAASGSEAYYCDSTKNTFAIRPKTEEHVVTPVIILPADLEFEYCSDYYYRPVCRTNIGGSGLVKSINLPQAIGDSFHYNGTPQMPELTYDEENVSVILPENYTNVGRYMGIFRLKNKDKTQWSGGGNGDISFVWEITGTPITTGEITQKGVLTFNGKEQTPRWKNFDDSKMTMKGFTSGTIAGTYDAFVFLKPGYTWSDGTTSPRKVKWKIDTRVIEVPTLSWKYSEYNGKSQEPVIDYHGNQDIIKTTKNYDSTPVDSGHYNIKFDLIEPDILPPEDIIIKVEEYFFSLSESKNKKVRQC